jgi:nucleotide-binding universal stress UspA family protein
MRDILFHATRHDRWEGAAMHAAQLCVTLRGRLTGVAIVPSPLSMMPPTYAPDALDLIVETTRQLEQAAVASGPDFLRAMAALGVADAAWQVAEGDAAHCLERLARCHDLLVLGRDDSHWGSTAGLGAIVLRARRPCLVLPSSAAAARAFDTVALAWNASAESLRAIHAALPLLARARRVVVLAGTPRGGYAEIGWEPPFELAPYLARHGLAAEFHALDGTDAEAPTRLLAATQAHGADLLVLGAYGHSRLDEWVFGGVTRALLEHAPLPLFLLH